MVARDGIEPPTPAFSGLLTDTQKFFGFNGSDCYGNSYRRSRIGAFGQIWARFALSMFPYCSWPPNVRELDLNWVVARQEQSSVRLSRTQSLVGAYIAANSLVFMSCLA